MNKYISKEKINELRNISIEDLLNRQTRKVGGQLTAHCPFHNPEDGDEKSASFYVYEENSYHCFSCGAHGYGAISFVMERDKLNFKEAIAYLDPNTIYNVQDQQQSPHEYLRSRGLDDEETKKRFGIMETTHSGHVAIQFNVPTGFKYRRFGIEPKYMHSKGSTAGLFKTEENKGEIGYINEGEIDSIVLYKHFGIPAWSASTGGASKTVFRNHLEEFASFKKIFLLYDSDTAGKHGARDVAMILGVEKCHIVECPVKDWSDFFALGYTREDFALLLQRAKPAIEVLKTTREDGKEDETDSKSKYLIVSNEEFLKMNFPKNPWLIQSIIRARGITVVAGDGGTGKSLFVLFMLLSILEGSEWLGEFDVPEPKKVLLLDKENDNENIQTNLKSMGITNKNLHIAMYPPSFQLMEFNSDTKMWQKTKAAELLHEHVVNQGIQVVVLDSFVDFFQGNENDPVQIAEFAASCQEIFPNCAIIIIHHESKPAQNSPQRKAGHRMRGSTHIYNMLGSALSISVNDLEKPEIIYVEHSKVRGGEKQKPFEVKMVIELDPDNKKETVVRGFEYLGEASPIRRKIDEAKQEIMNIAREHPNEWITTKDYKQYIKGQVGANNIVSGLKELTTLGNLRTSKGERNADRYMFNKDNESETDIDPDSFIEELERERQQYKTAN